MAFLQFSNVRVAGMSAAVPNHIDENKETYSRWGDYNEYVATTGVERRRVTLPDNPLCSSDLCVAAAERLIDELGWERGEIDGLVFVTQSPDYILPATSCVIQERLGLSSDCYTLDISLGCSGWVYALSTIAALMQTGGIRKGLLLAGDTCSRMVSHDDKSAFPLFGDAGTATALVYDENAAPMLFAMHTDGKGKGVIIINDGGFRTPFTLDSLKQEVLKEGIERSPLNVAMDGMSVFSFAISKAPKSVNELIEHFALDKDSIDYFSFHQANLFMNEKIRSKLKLPAEKVPYCIRDFGNTSCASIPLALVTQCQSDLQTKPLRHIACGFGVGLSWGSVYFESDSIACPGLVEI